MTQECQMNAVDSSPVQRLAELGSPHRRLQRLTLGRAALLIGTAVFAAATPTSRTLEIETLKLVDGQGKLRGLLTAASGLSIIDPSGRPRAVLGIDAEGPGLVL